MEDRLGKLEAHVEHIRSDISDLRVDVRRLADKVDGLNDLVGKEFRKFDRSRLYDRVWFLLIGATILGVMAHGFKWI